MESLTKEQLILKGGCYIGQITDGLDQYPYEQRKGSYEELRDFLIQQMEVDTSAYAEFYFGRLTKENRKLFQTYLLEQEVACLWEIKKQCEEKVEGEYCYVKMSQEICELMLKISFYELLFCTFYFLKQQICIWTNYDGELVIFYCKPKQSIE